ncbi:hypothetical protein GAGA_1311 [Paraglaciecola agarilytica NO2]|uniref:Transposase n=1 Tax=Paraglaciecola agarilytica NO2 TaxID=1125747 RepID=A0ABQ0I4D8_9ALTE|nr:hypothetical protein GAGA_1311 [Paraglaciecola agarilytica NO2]
MFQCATEVKAGRVPKTCPNGQEISIMLNLLIFMKYSGFVVEES